MIWAILPPYRTPYGKYKCKASPTIRPNAAPILNTGINIPDGTGMVDAIIEKMNCGCEREYSIKTRSKLNLYELCVAASNKLFKVIRYSECQVGGQMEENVGIRGAPMVDDRRLFHG